MMTLAKVMSLLVVSGHGDRCNNIKDNLKNLLLSVDERTGEMKVNIHKLGKEKFSEEDYKRICREVSVLVSPYLHDVNIRYYGNDRKYLAHAGDKK